MQHPERTRYFQLQRRVSLHTRRLVILILGTLCTGLLVVRTTAQTPPAGEQTLFRPFVLSEAPPQTSTDQATDVAGVPLPTLTLPPAGETQAGIPLPTPALSPMLFDDWRFTSEQGLSVAAVQTLLDAHPGPLKSLLITVGDRNMSVAEIIAGQAYLYSLNPKLILALLEYEQGLLSTPNPSDDQLAWALNYHGEDEKWQGLYNQIRWVTRELRRGSRDYMYATELEFKPETVRNADGEAAQRPVKGPIPAGLNPASYALIRTLAQTRTPQEMEQLVRDGSFVSTYTQLFEDPRTPLADLPAPAAPFLRSPLPKPIYVTSFFDHEYPYLTPNGSLVSWLGRREDAISYDGHDGWDYGLRPPDPILAAAAGTVLWVGNSDDGCYTPARGVVIDHGNGYRTLYWHLSEISVELGQAVAAGEQIGIVGSSGCAFGPHLHFQTQYLGRNVDPYGWCSGDADPWAVHPMGAPSFWLWADRPNPCGLPADVVLVTPDSPTFALSGAGWQRVPVGVQGDSLWIESQVSITATDAVTQTISELAGVAEPVPTFDPQQPPPPPAVARWQPELASSGQYRLLGYVPYFYNGLEDASAVKYTNFITLVVLLMW